MRVIFCYASSPDSRAVDAVEKYAPSARYVKCEGLFGYGEAISSRWTGESDLVVIEGDKEITEETIPSLQSCSEDWCTYSCVTLPEPYTKVTTISLACAKFSARLQTLVDASEFICPDVPWQPCRHCGNQGCWNQLDSRMQRAFESHGITKPHVHGEITHYHEYDADWWAAWKKDWDYVMDVDARMEEVQAWTQDNPNYDYQPGRAL